MNKKEYMKQYLIEHRQELNNNRKKWYTNHKEEQLAANKRFYHKLKEENNTWQQRNKNRVAINQKRYRNKKIAELREMGITNPYVVFLNKGVAKYESK